MSLAASKAQQDKVKELCCRDKAGRFSEGPILGRFMEKVVWNGDEDECWTWGAQIDREGYGRFWISEKKRTVGAHRVSYELFVGPIPAGLHIDHLCANRVCVNPAHLEPVSCHENVMRGTAPSAANALKTHCKHGHEFTPENTYVPPGRSGRHCRTCNRERLRKRRERKKATLR